MTVEQPPDAASPTDDQRDDPTDPVTEVQLRVAGVVLSRLAAAAPEVTAGAPALRLELDDLANWMLGVRGAPGSAWGVRASLDGSGHQLLPADPTQPHWCGWPVDNAAWLAYDGQCRDDRKPSR